jgi:hypothetical protein
LLRRKPYKMKLVGFRKRRSTQMGLKHTPVESSNIESISEHDGDNKCFEVRFKGGGLYRYKNVPKSAHSAFMSSDSKGKHFASEIKNKYEWEKLE